MELRCPPRHVEYLSQMLADNAMTLHSFIHPGCPGTDRWECGDHWHIGHKTKEDKQICVATTPTPNQRS